MGQDPFNRSPQTRPVRAPPNLDGGPEHCLRVGLGAVRAKTVDSNAADRSFARFASTRQGRQAKAGQILEYAKGAGTSGRSQEKAKRSRDKSTKSQEVS